MKRAGDLLSVFFQEHFDPASLENGRLMAGLFTSWAAAAKAVNISAAADHSRIKELEHNVLVIEAEHPGWVQILQTKQSQLLKYVQLKFSELDIQGISFCLSREHISPIASNNAPVFREEMEENETVEVVPQSRKNEDLYEPIEKLRQVLKKRNREL